MTNDKQNDVIENNLKIKTWLDTEPNAPKHYTKHGNIEVRNLIRTELERAQRMRAALQAIERQENNQSVIRIKQIAKQALSDAPTIKPPMPNIGDMVGFESTTIDGAKTMVLYGKDQIKPQYGEWLPIDEAKNYNDVLVLGIDTLVRQAYPVGNGCWQNCDGSGLLTHEQKPVGFLPLDVLPDAPKEGE